MGLKYSTVKEVHKGAYGKDVVVMIKHLDHIGVRRTLLFVLYIRKVE